MKTNPNLILATVLTIVAISIHLACATSPTPEPVADVVQALSEIAREEAGEAASLTDAKSSLPSSGSEPPADEPSISELSQTAFAWATEAGKDLESATWGRQLEGRRRAREEWITKRIQELLAEKGHSKVSEPESKVNEAEKPVEEQAAPKATPVLRPSPEQAKTRVTIAEDSIQERIADLQNRVENLEWRLEQAGLANEPLDNFDVH